MPLLKFQPSYLQLGQWTILRLLAYQMRRPIAIDAFLSRSPYIKFLLFLCDIFLSSFFTVTQVSFPIPSFLPSFLRLVYPKFPAVLTPASEFALNFLFNKTNRSTNFPNLFCQEILHISGSFSAHHQEFSTVQSALACVMQV